MSTPTSSSVRPEDCPEPGWHETHRYCPACSWTEPDPRIDCGATLIVQNADSDSGPFVVVCNLPYRHAQRNGTQHANGMGTSWELQEPAS